jgi:hypothetical protein
MYLRLLNVRRDEIASSLFTFYLSDLIKQSELALFGILATAERIGFFSVKEVCF